MANSLKELLDRWSSFGNDNEVSLPKNSYYNSITDSVDFQGNQPVTQTQVDPDYNPNEPVTVGKKRAAEYLAAQGEGTYDMGAAQPIAVPTTGVQGSTPQSSRPESQYEKYVRILKDLQEKERNSTRDINMIRGANQIAQAIASGQGAKIGDGSAQLDKLQQAAEKPIKDYQTLLKAVKDGQIGSGKSPIGFGQFTNKKGEPLSMLPDGRIINNVTQREHDPADGVIRAAVDRIIYDADGTPTVYRPGIDTEQSVFNKGMNAAGGIQGSPDAQIPSGLSPSQQMTPQLMEEPKSPYDARMRIPKRDRDALDKDVDQFQQEVKDALRVKAELQNAGPILEQAKTNPAAARAAGALVAQIFQGGRLSDKDIDVYVGRYGVGNWLKDAYNKLVNGTHSPEMLDQVKEYIDLYATNLEKTLPLRAKLKARTISERFPPHANIPPSMIERLYYSPENTGNPELQEAKAWLSANPNHELAEQVREKIKRMEQQ